MYKDKTPYLKQLICICQFKVCKEVRISKLIEKKEPISFLKEQNIEAEVLKDTYDEKRRSLLFGVWLAESYNKDVISLKLVNLFMVQ